MPILFTPLSESFSVMKGKTASSRGVSDEKAGALMLLVCFCMCLLFAEVEAMFSMCILLLDQRSFQCGFSNIQYCYLQKIAVYDTRFELRTLCAPSNKKKLTIHQAGYFQKVYKSNKHLKLTI